MSKNKEKNHGHESADKSRTAEDRRQTEKSGTETPRETGPAPENSLSTGRPTAPQAAMEASKEKEAPAAPTGSAGQADQLAQLTDRLLRLQADFDNFRKRTLREKGELFESANQALMLELLPVLDHLQLGIKAATDQGANPAFREGLALIFDQLMGVLSKFGLSFIETENKNFDPNLCEAVNVMPSATEPEGKILVSVRRGYMLRGKLLRPAQVIVSGGPPKEDKADDRRRTTDAGQEKTKNG